MNQELIARLEAATSPARPLDHSICDEVFGKQSWSSPSVEWCRLYRWMPTASIDAALSLLPEWASYELTRSAAGEPTFTRCRLWDWRRGPLMSDPNNEWKSEGNRPLPINIIIAALKTRAAR